MSGWFILIFLFLNIQAPQQALDPRELTFVEAFCDCCNKSLTNEYRYYKLDCNHIFCMPCFSQHTDPIKSCFLCGFSLLYPELSSSDLFSENTL